MKYKYVFGLISTFYLLVSGFLLAQPDSSWNVLVIQRGKDLKIRPDMSDFNTTGFYLYKNCVYEFELKNKSRIGGRLVDIKQDSLLFTNFFNATTARNSKAKLDTFTVHYNQLERLNLIADRAMRYYNRVKLDNYDFIFQRDTINYYFPSQWEKIYANDANRYELVAHLTAQGVDMLFEDSGRTYFFYGSGIVKPDRSDFDDSYDKRFVFWFTPCRVEEINGLALGLHPKNLKNQQFNERDSLLIRGINLEINPFSIFSLTHPNLHGPFPDSLAFYEENLKSKWEVKLSGLHISAITTINEMHIKGFNLTGAITVVDELHGISISGLSSFSYLMHGLSIAGLYNRAAFAKGVQIGLYNKAADLRGFQIGLWNVNGRRSLPFINWQFKTKR